MKFADRVRAFVSCTDDVEDELEFFYTQRYTEILLKGNGLIGYIELDDYYFIVFVYTDRLLSNAKRVYNTSKELSKLKPVLYSGTRDYYGNNSIKLDDDLYQIRI